MKNLMIIILIIEPFCLFAQKDSILVKEASFRYEVIEPVYEVVTEKFLKKAASPAMYFEVTYETVTEQVYKKEPSFTYSIKQPIYKEIIVEAENGEGGTIKIKRKIIETPASFEKIEIPAEFQVITKSVIMLRMEHTKPKVDYDSKPPIPAKPAEYQYVSFEKLKTPAKLIKVEIPPIYKYFN